MKTLLDAVNMMLETINEQPLTDDVDLDNSLEGQIARTVLLRKKNSILSDGWDVNSDEAFQFTPDSNGIIGIPSNVLEITSLDGRSIMRDWRLYNKVEKTFKYTSPVLCDVKWDIEFEDLTFSLAYYIAVSAAREFQMHMIGDTSIDNALREEQSKALIKAESNEGFTDQSNMLDSMRILLKRSHF